MQTNGDKTENLSFLTPGCLRCLISAPWDTWPLGRGTSGEYCEAQARVRQGSARDGSQGKRPQSLNPCLELTLKLVAPPSFLPTTTRKSNFSNVYGWNGSGKVGRDNGRYIGAKWVMLLCWDGSHRG